VGNWALPRDLACLGEPTTTSVISANICIKIEKINVAYYFLINGKIGDNV
jgi:hypothetical protein